MLKLSDDGGHHEFPIGTKNITFIEIHPMTIPAMFALNYGYWFQRRNFFDIFP